MNETTYSLNDHMFDLERIAELTNVYSSTEHQSAETYSWKRHIPMRPKLTSTGRKDQPVSTLTPKAITRALKSGRKIKVRQKQNQAGLYFRWKKSTWCFHPTSLFCATKT